MGAKAKVFVTLALAGACGLLALPSMASAAPSGVTIHLGVGNTFKGFVFSPKPRQCAQYRRAKLYRQRGKGQHPKRDAKVAKTAAQPYSDGRYKWRLIPSRPRPGDFYARVPVTAGCQGDNSRTVHVSRRPNTEITEMSVTHDRNVKFRYIGLRGIAPYNFQCKLDDKPYRHCPDLQRRYVGLSHGHHVFRVRARGDNGKQDRTPARRGFRI
jgi:hypothetical protein